MITLTKRQARQFMLLKQGLIGDHKFIGKQGALDFVRQASCIQFDPIDICGKNTELVCQSRVKGFKKSMLHELLYEDRVLVDYLDKNVALILTEDWAYFGRYRQVAREQEADYPEMQAFKAQMRAHILANGVTCSNDLKLDGDFYWQSAIHWSSGKNLSRSILEQMYTTGELIIHHKKGSRKFYDLAEKYIAADLLSAPDPLPDEFDHFKWRTLRRIGAVGLIWNAPSDAWLNIWNFKAEHRNKAFATLLREDKILKLAVEGMKQNLYCRAEDIALIEAVLEGIEPEPRCELIAPLDNFMWDRKLIKALFDFDYTWEIYTPVVKRKYGHYVLPLLFGENFIGRAEIVVDQKNNTLIVKNIWLEAHVRQTKKLQATLERCFHRFAAFNDCTDIQFQGGFNDH